MVRAETVWISVQELTRVPVIRHSMHTALRQRVAGEVLGVTPFQRRTRLHRAWRARNAPRSAWVQRAGSPPDWFEGRGPRCVRMAFIAEARRPVGARFDA